jgi:exodeoxyribonuclease-3
MNNRAMTLKVGTWNVNGIRARETQVVDWIAAERPDVVCLQETKAPRDKVPLWLLELPGYWCLWHGTAAYSGVALNLSRETFPEAPVYSHPEFDHESRIAVADAGGRRFVSTYVPNGGKDYDAKVRFLTALGRFAEETRAAGRELVICGDLNVALTDQDVHPKERKPGIIGQRPEERALLSQLIGHGLWTWGGRWTRSTPASSPGGRPGETCASATSAGAWTTSWPASPWPGAWSSARCGRRSAPPTTRRWWRFSPATRSADHRACAPSDGTLAPWSL